MAITFVGSAIGSSVSGTSFVMSLAGITGLAQNDIVIVASCYYNDSPSTEAMMEPTSNDYTQIALVTPGGSAVGALYVGYKRMTATPDTSLIFQGSDGGINFGSAAVALAFRGVHLTTAIDVAATTATVTPPAAPNPPSITPISDNCVIVAFGGQVAGTGDTSPGSITNYLPSPVITALGNDTQDGQVGAAYRILSGAAGVAQDPAAFSTWATTSATRAYAATVALRPASVIETVTVTQATVTFTGKTVTVRNFETVTQATVTAVGKTVTVREFELVVVDKATVTIAGQTVVGFGTGGEFIAVDEATVAFAGKTVTISETPTVIYVDRALLAFTGKTVALIVKTPVDRAAVMFTGRTVTVGSTAFERVPKYIIRGRGSRHDIKGRGSRVFLVTR